MAQQVGAVVCDPHAADRIGGREFMTSVVRAAIGAGGMMPAVRAGGVRVWVW